MELPWLATTHIYSNTLMLIASCWCYLWAGKNYHIGITISYIFPPEDTNCTWFVILERKGGFILYSPHTSFCFSLVLFTSSLSTVISFYINHTCHVSFLVVLMSVLVTPAAHHRSALLSLSSQYCIFVTLPLFSVIPNMPPKSIIMKHINDLN